MLNEAEAEAARAEREIGECEEEIFADDKLGQLSAQDRTELENEVFYFCPWRGLVSLGATFGFFCMYYILTHLRISLASSPSSSGLPLLQFCLLPLSLSVLPTHDFHPKGARPRARVRALVQAVLDPHDRARLRARGARHPRRRQARARGAAGRVPQRARPFAQGARAKGVKNTGATERACEEKERDLDIA